MTYNNIPFEMIEQIIQSLANSPQYKHKIDTYSIIPFTEKNDYSACTLYLDQTIVLYRQAKMTPKKEGLFVAIWKRNENDDTAPYSIDDSFDYLLIAVDTGIEKGYFLFPKEVLVELNLISSAIKEGKRGTRIYPQQTVGMNRQALVTYSKQIRYYHTV